MRSGCFVCGGRWPDTTCGSSTSLDMSVSPRLGPSCCSRYSKPALRARFDHRPHRPNRPFDEWTSVFGSERLTGALLGRLARHVHILGMNGDSCSSIRAGSGAHAA